MSKSLEVTVDLADRTYPIYIGAGVLGEMGPLLTPVLRQKRVFIVTDSNVGPLYLEKVQAVLADAGIEIAGQKTVVAGEASKSFAVLQDLLEAMLAAKVERKTSVLALGGGVVGDLAGFAASVMLRGVDFVQVPTSLLAQVDSSVGGKTGINTAYGKNLVGAFHQPRAVLIDTDVLATLPRRELLAGYAEVCKYGLLGDASFWRVLVDAGAKALDDPMVLAQFIRTSCEAKAQVVAADEKESGQRALLNLGHTFGHALEAELAYDGSLLHGEGVAIGMVLAFVLSERLGLCPPGRVDEIVTHFNAVGLPTRIPAKADGARLSAEVLYGHMGQDKKVADGDIVFVLARDIGQALLQGGIAKDDVMTVLEDYLV